MRATASDGTCVGEDTEFGFRATADLINGLKDLERAGIIKAFGFPVTFSSEENVHFGTLWDFVVARKKSENALYSKIDTLQAILPRGLSLLQVDTNLRASIINLTASRNPPANNIHNEVSAAPSFQAVNEVFIARRGFKKFLDFPSSQQALQEQEKKLLTLLSRRSMQLCPEDRPEDRPEGRPEGQPHGLKRLGAEMLDSMLQQQPTAKLGHYIAIFAQKLNGGTLQLSYFPFLQSWVVASKSVAVCARRLADIQSRTHPRYRFLKAVAPLWFELVDSWTPLQQDLIRHLLSRKTLILEALAVDGYEHLVIDAVGAASSSSSSPPPRNEESGKGRIVVIGLVDLATGADISPLQLRKATYSILQTVRITYTVEADGISQLVDECDLIAQALRKAHLAMAGEGCVLSLVDSVEHEVVWKAKIKTDEYLMLRGVREAALEAAADPRRNTEARESIADAKFRSKFEYLKNDAKLNQYAWLASKARQLVKHDSFSEKFIRFHWQKFYQRLQEFCAESPAGRTPAVEAPAVGILNPTAANSRVLTLPFLFSDHEVAVERKEGKLLPFVKPNFLAVDFRPPQVAGAATKNRSPACSDVKTYYLWRISPGGCREAHLRLETLHRCLETIRLRLFGRKPVLNGTDAHQRFVWGLRNGPQWSEQPITPHGSTTVKHVIAALSEWPLDLLCHPLDEAHFALDQAYERICRFASLAKQQALFVIKELSAEETPFQQPRLVSSPSYPAIRQPHRKSYNDADKDYRNSAAFSAAASSSAPNFILVVIPIGLPGSGKSTIIHGFLSAILRAYNGFTEMMISDAPSSAFIGMHRQCESDGLGFVFRVSADGYTRVVLDRLPAGAAAGLSIQQARKKGTVLAATDLAKGLQALLSNRGSDSCFLQGSCNGVILIDKNHTMSSVDSTMKFVEHALGDDTKRWSLKKQVVVCGNFEADYLEKTMPCEPRWLWNWSASTVAECLYRCYKRPSHGTVTPKQSILVVLSFLTLFRKGHFGSSSTNISVKDISFTDGMIAEAVLEHSSRMTTAVWLPTVVNGWTKAPGDRKGAALYNLIDSIVRKATEGRGILGFREDALQNCAEEVHELTHFFSARESISDECPSGFHCAPEVANFIVSAYRHHMERLKSPKEVAANRLAGLDWRYSAIDASGVPWDDLLDCYGLTAFAVRRGLLKMDRDKHITCYFRPPCVGNGALTDGRPGVAQAALVDKATHEIGRAYTFDVVGLVACDVCVAAVCKPTSFPAPTSDRPLKIFHVTLFASSRWGPKVSNEVFEALVTSCPEAQSTLPAYTKDGKRYLPAAHPLSCDAGRDATGCEATVSAAAARSCYEHNHDHPKASDVEQPRGRQKWNLKKADGSRRPISLDAVDSVQYFDVRNFQVSIKGTLRVHQ